MLRHRVILSLIVCVSVAVFASQSRRGRPIRPPNPLDMKGMTEEEKQAEYEKWRMQINQERLKENDIHMKLMAREAWKRLLRINEQQWKIIEPKCEEVRILKYEARACALGWGGSSKRKFHWQRHSKGSGGTLATSPNDMTEGQKIADALVDLLEDDNSTDEAIRQKIDALQKARENARTQLPKAKEELAKILTTPRQEAVFLLIGSID